MFSYDNKNDAHKISNYNEWKKTSHIIQDIRINFKSTGISEGDFLELANCLELKKPFCLVNNKMKMVIIIPEFFTIKQGKTRMTYQNEKQLFNAIKLLLFNFNKVYVPDLNILNDAGICKNIRARLPKPKR